MAIDLSAWIISGEIDNTRRHCTSGTLHLQNYRYPIAFDLTGECHTSLQGRWIRFARVGEPTALGQNAALNSLAWNQIGPTGQIRLDRLDDDTLAQLIITWEGQNGPIVARLGLIRLLQDELAPPTEIDTFDLDIARSLPHDIFPDDGDDEDADALATFDTCDDDEEDDPYHLFPPSLQSHIDQQTSLYDDPPADDADLAGRGTLDAWSHPAGDLREGEANPGHGVRIADLFETPMKLPRPAELDEAAATAALKNLLAALARHGIALHICDHFDCTQAYTLLVEDICQNEFVHPAQGRSAWTLHYDTSESCPDCEEAFEREIEARNRDRSRKDEGDDDASF